MNSFKCRHADAFCLAIALALVLPATAAATAPIAPHPQDPRYFLFQAKIEHPDRAVQLFNFHYAAPPDVIALNSGLNRAIGDDETGFKGIDDRVYRTEAWEFLLAGGSVFSNLDYSFTVANPDGVRREGPHPRRRRPYSPQAIDNLARLPGGIRFRADDPGSLVDSGRSPGQSNGARTGCERARLCGLSERRRSRGTQNGLACRPIPCGVGEPSNRRRR